MWWEDYNPGMDFHMIKWHSVEPYADAQLDVTEITVRGSVEY